MPPDCRRAPRHHFHRELSQQRHNRPYHPANNGGRSGVSGVITDIKEVKSETTGARASSALPPLGRILLVEDEPELRNILIESLTRQGFETAAYSSGIQALAELRKRDFDLLLT